MSSPRFFVGNSKWWKLPWAILIIIVWLCLWYFPWQAKLPHIFWIQLGVGLAVFIVPGLCVYNLLSNRSHLDSNHITFGFVISHLILALLGTVGRLIHLPFKSITFLMMALGLILLLVCALPKVGRGIKFQMDRERSTYILSMLPILLVSLLVGLIVIQRMLSDDDLTYLAYMTNIRSSASLNFNDPVFGESQLASPRFWIMSAPFAQAFLAEISRMPGILILGGYYEPFLVILSVLCWYELAITLKLSPRVASISVILQLLFLLLLSDYLHPGAPYFEQLSADKATAAFIFAPVVFQGLIKLLEDSTRNNIFLLLLTGLSLSFMHPIILAYTVFIGGMLILLSKTTPRFGNKLILIVILFILLIPQIAIRFARVSTAQPISYDPEVILSQDGTDNLVARWRDTEFYGFNPNILTMKTPYEAMIPLPEQIIKWSWILIPIFAFVIALKRRDSIVAQFILSCFALCFLTGFPFTGWVIGYFLSGRMLARSVWLFPFGLSTVFLLLAIRDITLFGKYTSAWMQKMTLKVNLSGFALIIFTAISSIMILLFLREQQLPDFAQFEAKIRRYGDIAKVGQYLDQHIATQAIVIGPEALNDYMPGVSGKSKLVVFRIASPSNMIDYTLEDIEKRKSDRQMIFSETATPDEKLDLLKKYDIRFVVLQGMDRDLFADLLASYPSLTTMEKVGRFFVIEIH